MRPSRAAGGPVHVGVHQEGRVKEKDVFQLHGALSCKALEGPHSSEVPMPHRSPIRAVALRVQVLLTSCRPQRGRPPYQAASKALPLPRLLRLLLLLATASPLPAQSSQSSPC